MSHCCTTTTAVLPATNLLFADICPPNYSEKDPRPLWYHSEIHDVTQGVQTDDMESSQDVRSSAINLGDIDTRWKRRVGWPRLLNAPVFTDELTQHDFAKDSSDLEVLESRIKEILGKYEISCRGRDGFHVRYRRQRRHQGKVHFGLLRVLVECVYDPEQQQRHPDSWPLAVIDIHKAIRETVNDPRDIGIELYDGVYEHSIRLSPDLPEDCQDFVRNWSGGRNYRQQILDLFENKPNLWQAMLLTGLKASNERTRDHKCVLWFDAIDASNPLWPQLETEIASILPDNIPIEIWQASHKILCAGTNSTSSESDHSELSSGPGNKQLKKEDFQRPPKPGSSVGVMADATDAGTLGGYIRVSQDTVDPHGNATTSERTYGLTNAHVVLGLDPENFRKLWSKQQQLHLTTDPTERLPVQCPSKVDCDKYLRPYNDTIELHRSRITANMTTLSYLRGNNDPDNKVLEDGISNASNRINQLLLKTRMAREDRYLADVRAVAFNRRSHKCPDFQNRLFMDLALIDVTDLIPDPSAVSPPAEEPLILKRSILGTWDADRLGSGAKDDSINLVAMFSRSGFKQGRIHPIKVDIKLKDLDKKVHTFSAWVVSSIDEGAPFATPGDSGSFIITGRNWKLPRPDDGIVNLYEETELTVVGLLFAATVDSKFGYFIPFDAVVDEVEALTGGKVTWPVKREHD